MRAILDIPSTPGLVKQVYSATPEAFASFLEKYPKHGSLIWADEPYTNIQGKRKTLCLQMLCNDPRFQFDHLFVARMLYFSTREVHETICRHPRFKELMKDKKSFMEFFSENYPGGQEHYMGMSQRYIQAWHVISIHRKKKEKNLRLAFILYPFLNFVARNFIERYYAPGGKGYLKGKESFESLAAIDI